MDLLTFELDPMGVDEFISLYQKNKEDYESKLLKHGAIKFKNVLIDDSEDFQKIIDKTSDEFLNYIDGNSPRTKLSGNIYTSTEYDKTQKITMHNELSYSATWPGKIYFTCIQPSQSGGETLLADSREIVKAMPKEIVNEIEEKGIKYIRNLHGGLGLGPSWQDTFEASSKSEVEHFLSSNNIEYMWSENDVLKIIQYSKGIIKHRQTKELLWFNQIDQFHPSQLGKEIYEATQLMYESSSDFPMYVQFGDDTEISKDMVEEINKNIDLVTIAPKWEKNEFLILDNESICHGRNSFTGNRYVLVSMSK